MRLRTLLLLCSTALYASAVSGQPFVSGDITKLAASIRSGKLSSENEKALALSCEADRRVAVERVSLRKGTKNQVVQVSGQGCAFEDLLIFEPRGNAWVLVDRLVVNARDSRPDISFVSLVDRGQEEMVVRNQVVNSGLGSYQENLTVFRWIGGHLAVVLDAAQNVDYDVAYLKGRYSVKQTSDFSALPVAEQSGSLQYFLEKQTLAINSADPQVRWREWVWDSSVNRFRAVETYPDSGAEASSRQNEKN